MSGPANLVIGSIILALIAVVMAVLFASMPEVSGQYGQAQNSIKTGWMNALFLAEVAGFISLYVWAKQER